MVAGVFQEESQVYNSSVGGGVLTVPSLSVRGYLW